MAFTQFGKKTSMKIKVSKCLKKSMYNIIFFVCSVFNFILTPNYLFAGGSSMHSPIEQFVVKTILDIKDPFFGFDISFTNASLFMVLASIVPLIILGFGRLLGIK